MLVLVLLNAISFEFRTASLGLLLLIEIFCFSRSYFCELVCLFAANFLIFSSIEFTAAKTEELFPFLLSRLAERGPIRGEIYCLH